MSGEGAPFQAGQRVKKSSYKEGPASRACTMSLGAELCRTTPFTKIGRLGSPRCLLAQYTTPACLAQDPWCLLGAFHGLLSQ
jgi:hypothetical protein